MTGVIAFVIPSLASGGAERVVASLAASLARDFRTLIFLRKGGPRHYDIDGVEICEIDFTAEGISRAVAEHGVDVVLDHYHWDADHVQIMSALAESGLRVILTEHNAYHYPLFQWARDRRKGYDDWFDQRYEHYGKFAAVTVLNEDARSYFSRHLDNVRLIQNPVPYPVDGVAVPRRPTVLNVSHFRKRAKRLDLLYGVFARVAARMPEARLVILGDYDWLQDRYLRQATGLTGANVSCPGRTRLVAQYYDEASVFALPSEIEGQPMVLLEAALHGVPQVAFDLPGLRDQIIDGETGYLVPFGDLEGFSSRIGQLLDDPGRAARMGQAGRAFVLERFGEDRVAQEWRRLIEEVMTAGRATSAVQPLADALAGADGRWRAYWQGVSRNEPAGIAPKISFLVPVYGTEELLGRCLRSIQQQTLVEFECIIVDDASPGDVAAAVQAAVGDDARFRLVRHTRNRGLYQARSTAAAAARGLYFANVDSDDYIHPQFAEIMFAEAMTTGAEIVECKAVELMAEGRPIRFNSIERLGPADGTEAARAFFNNSLRNVVWNKIYARDLWERTPDHAEIDVGLSITEDLLRNSLLFPRCKRYSAVRDCLYFYCRRPSSVVKGGDLDRLLAKLRDIDFSYGKAMQLHDDPGSERTWFKLQSRRIEDLQWYIAEFVQRSDLMAIRRELRAKGNAVDPMLELVMTIIDAQTRLKTSYDRMLRGWQWERDRADRLETRLQEARRIGGN